MGPVDFRGADIKSEFQADAAQFLNEKEGADFSSIKVGVTASIENAIFNGPAFFDRADIKEQFQANNAQFLNESQGVSFKNMRVGQGAYLNKAIFKGNVNLTHGAYLDLFIEGSPDKKKETVKFDLRGTTVQREFSLKNFRLSTLNAGELRATGFATFEDLIIEEANFQNAAIGTLRFSNTIWPENQGTRKLDGLTYTSLAFDEPNSFPNFLDFVKKSSFNPQNYIQLENCCKQAGRKNWADTVYIALQDCGLAQQSCYDDFSKWLKMVIWKEIGYGRKPGRLFFYWFVWIFLGMLVFNPRFIEGQWVPRPLYPRRGLMRVLMRFWLRLLPRARHPHRWLMRQVMRFWLSLDRFLPGIDLGLAKNWNPKNQVSSIIWIFWYTLKLLGWCLIPLGFAYISATIKG